jgi:Mrp family chromosome partitioning ATPase
MTFEQYWAILVRRWKLILLCSLLVGAGAYAGSKRITRLYQSTALVRVVDNSDRSVYNALLASEQLTQTEVDLATSDLVLRAVAARYGMTVAQLSNEVTAVTKLNTQLFEIDVRDPLPSRAAALTNDIVATLQGQELLAERQGQGGKPRISLVTVQPARPAQTPVLPDVRLNTAIGLVTGLLLGMLLAVLRGQLDSRVRTPQALSRLLDLPVLASVKVGRSSRPGARPFKHTTNTDGYELLGRNIEFLGLENPLRSLLITSAEPREGKSSVAANLASILAGTGRATLLVDANLRDPSVHQTFDLRNSDVGLVGLTNAVLALNEEPIGSSNPHISLAASGSRPRRAGGLATDPLLWPYIESAGTANLWVMPSGPLPPNSAALFGSKAMQRLLAAAGDEFDIVIFDGPPLSDHQDADALASKVDAALIVVDLGRATERRLEEAKSRLLQGGARTLACVIAETAGRFRRGR